MNFRLMATGSEFRKFVILNLLFVISTSTAQAVEVDGIAARVGTDTILKSDVYEEMQMMGERDESRFAAVRNEMIDRKLILRAAGEAKMTLQDWVVDSRIREIVNKSFDGDRNKLVEMLAKHKVSYPEWVAKTKEGMIVSAMRWNVVDKNVNPSPAAMKAEYESHPERYSQGRKVSLSVIILKPEEVGKREEISTALKTKSFEELGGKKYAAVKPEDLFQPEIVKEIEKMPKGTISHWIEIDGWSFLLRKEGEDRGKKLSFEEAYDQIESAVRAAESKRLYEAWIDRLRAETYIRVF